MGQYFQMSILLADTASYRRHDGISRPFFSITQTQIYGFRHWLLLPGIVQPAREPDGGGSGSNS